MASDSANDPDSDSDSDSVVPNTISIWDRVNDSSIANDANVDIDSSTDIGSYKLPPISHEQEQAILSLRTHNVLIDSVAGCGKTTTNLYIAKRNPTCRILLLTYNSKLKLETRTRVAQSNIDNVEVQTYHGFCKKYYYPCDGLFTDLEIMKSLKEQPVVDISFDIIILDEAQDITEVYFELICKLYNDNKAPGCGKAKLCVLGDRYQSIYQFGGADDRYITHASTVFALNGLPWETHCLSKSFRITTDMAMFINNCMLHYNRILSDKKTKTKPRYIVCNTYGLSPYNEIIKYFKMGYLPSDIFVLAGSVKKSRSKNSTPIRSLANNIKDLTNTSIYIPGSDDQKLDESIMAGKLVFSTFHQAKGLERNVVIIMGFDNSYFEMYNKDADPNICPNTLYVGTTRAKEHLSLIREHRKSPLPFLNTDLLGLYCDVVYEKQYMMKTKPSKVDKNRKNDRSVCELIKHIPCVQIQPLLEMVKITKVIKKRDVIDIPIKVEQPDGSYELVCDISGTAIPAYFEYKYLTNNMTIYNAAVEYEKDIDRFPKNWHLSTGDCNISNTNNYRSKYKSKSTSNEGQVSPSSVDIDMIKQLLANDPDYVDADQCVNLPDEPAVDRIADDNGIITHPNKLSDYDVNNLTISQLLYITNRYDAYTTLHKFKICQIKTYNWITPENMNKCMVRLKTLRLSKKSKFEAHVIKSVNRGTIKNIVGSIDCISKRRGKVSVYEFKCVRELTQEHFLQLVVYMYLHKIKYPRADSKYYLYNILNHEMWELSADKQVLEIVFNSLIQTKINVGCLSTDTQFLKKQKKTRIKYIQ
jgi:hypothetical protein